MSTLQAALAAPAQAVPAQAVPAQAALAAPALAALAAPATQRSTNTSSDHSLSYQPHELLVVGMDQTALSNVRQLGFEATYVTGDGDAVFPITRLKVPAGTDTLTALRTLKLALPGQIVALNSLYRLYNGASGVDEPAEAPGAGGSCTSEACRPWTVIGWKSYLRGCSSGLRVGMIDTGIDTTHPSLAGGAAAARIVTEEFHLPHKKPAASTHGTAVASLLIGDARQGVAGLVPDVTLYAADTFYADGNQSVTDTFSLLKAIDWMRSKHVRIVNMSFSGPDDPLLKAAIAQSIEEGMVIVAAAGNDGADAPAAYPAAYPNVIAVTAVTADLKPYQRANHGFYISLSAPGVHIWTAAGHGKGAFESGTSFAAPYVTAIAATLLGSIGRTANAGEILQSIKVKDLGEPDKDPVFGRGLALAPKLTPADCDSGRTAERLRWVDGTVVASGAQ